MNKENRSKYFSTPARLSSLPTFDSSISTLRFRKEINGNVGLNNTLLTCQEERNTRSPNEKGAYDTGSALVPRSGNLTDPHEPAFKSVNHRFQRVRSGTSSSEQRDYKGVSTRSTTNTSEYGAQLKR